VALRIRRYIEKRNASHPEQWLCRHPAHVVARPGDHPPLRGSGSRASPTLLRGLRTPHQRACPRLVGWGPTTRVPAAAVTAVGTDWQPPSRRPGSRQAATAGCPVAAQRHAPVPTASCVAPSQPPGDRASDVPPPRTMPPRPLQPRSVRTPSARPVGTAPRRTSRRAIGPNPGCDDRTRTRRRRSTPGEADRCQGPVRWMSQPPRKARSSIGLGPEVPRRPSSAGRRSRRGWRSPRWASTLR
jgi:hypothetical protein